MPRNSAPPTGRVWATRIKHHCTAIVIALWSGWTCAQPAPVETDPQVIRLLPQSYPIERVQVDAREYPWSAIGRISALGGRHACTGTLVCDKVVLTAAHCVWRFRKLPQELHFLAGFQRDSYVAHSRAKVVHIADAYTNQRPSIETFADDWALLELENPIGKQAGTLGWAFFDSEVLKRLIASENRFALSGYRGDRRFVQTVDHDCRIDRTIVNGRLLVHECPIMRGDSGGPILLQGQREGYRVVGIDVGGSGRARHDRRGPQVKIEVGYAVPSASFAAKLGELCGGKQPLPGAHRLMGRHGAAPRTGQ